MSSRRSIWVRAAALIGRTKNWRRATRSIGYRDCQASAPTVSREGRTAPPPSPPCGSIINILSGKRLWRRNDVPRKKEKGGQFPVRLSAFSSGRVGRIETAYLRISILTRRFFGSFTPSGVTTLLLPSPKASSVMAGAVLPSRLFSSAATISARRCDRAML